MESLKLGCEVFEAAYGRVVSGYFGGESGGFSPATFAAAQSEVARREEERKVKEEVRREARSKERKPPQTLGPRHLDKGCLIGGRREDLAPWWIVMEDYFRPVAMEDMLAVLPDRTTLDPLTDPAFRVPQVGQDVDLVDEGEFWDCAKQDEGLAEGRKSSGNTYDDSKGTAQRRSHRLASKNSARDEPFPSGGYDATYWEETADLEQFPPWLNLPQPEDETDRVPPIHLLGLCDDDDVAMLVSHVELSKETAAAPEIHLLNMAGMVASGQLHGERSELQDKLNKEIEANQHVQEHSSCKFNQTPQTFGVELDPPKEQREENGILGVNDQSKRADSCNSAAAGTSESDHNSASESRVGGCRDMMDPLHPSTTVLLNQTLPPHVFKCPSTPRTVCPEPRRPFEASKSLATGSPVTPVHERPSISRDIDSGPPSVGELAEIDQTPFRFPELTDQNCTPCFPSKGRARWEEGNDRSSSMLTGGPLFGASSSDIRGTSARRKRPEVDYSALAGRTGPSSVNHTAGKRKAYKCGVGGHSEVIANPTLVAVQVAITEGGVDGGLEEQWQQLDLAKDIGILESAPDDEIMADIVACQSELLQQSATNRVRLKKTIEEVLEERPSVLDNMARKDRMEQDILEFTKAIADNRRDKQREKRELSRKRNSEKAGVGNPFPVLSPRRSCPPRPFHPGAFTPRANTTSRINQCFDFPEKMVDPLSVRGTNGEAVCAVCGQLQCNTANILLFCERCSIAVHQDCYGVAEPPEREWLCWPCKVYEEKLQKDGMPAENVIASRGGENSSDSERKKSTGGSREVDCALCPVKWGAFKLSTDKLRWVHVACCHAHRETSLLPGNICEAVEGLQDIPNSRWTVTCDVCGRKEGAVLRCAQGNCTKAFHFLCAQREGLASMNPSQRLGQTSQFACSVHCKNHEAIRKETVPPAMAAELAARQKNKLKPRRIVDHAAEVPQSTASFLSQAQASPLTGAMPSIPPAPVVDMEIPWRSDGNLALLLDPERQKALESLEEKKKDFQELYKLRIDLEGVRLLCAECKRRERLKVCIATAKVNQKKTILSDITKYIPFIDTIFPDKKGEVNGIQEQKVAPPTIPAAPASEQGVVAGPSAKRGRPVGPRSTRGAVKQAETESANVTPKTSSRKVARGNKGRVKKQLGLTQFFETSGTGDGGTDPSVRSALQTVRGRSTRAMTRNAKNTAVGQLAVQERHKPELATVPSRNEPGPNKQPQIDGVIESLGRSGLGKRSRSRRSGADDVRQILAPERALTGEEAQEINFEIRPRGYAFVRNDKMEVDKECEQNSNLVRGTSSLE